LWTLQAQHEDALAAQQSAGQQEVVQLARKLSQEAATHAAKAQVYRLAAAPTSM